MNYYNSLLTHDSKITPYRVWFAIPIAINFIPIEHYTTELCH